MPHFDPHHTSLESTVARRVELLGGESALDRLHRFADGAQVAFASRRGVDVLVTPELESVHEPAQHVDGIGEPTVRLQSDARRLEAGRLTAMRVAVGEREARRRRGTVRERLLPNRGERVVLGQLVAGNDGLGRAGIGHGVGHVWEHP